MAVLKGASKPEAWGFFWLLVYGPGIREKKKPYTLRGETTREFSRPLTALTGPKSFFGPNYFLVDRVTARRRVSSSPNRIPYTRMDLVF